MVSMALVLMAWKSYQGTVGYPSSCVVAFKWSQIPLFSSEFVTLLAVSLSLSRYISSLISVDDRV